MADLDVDAADDSWRGRRDARWMTMWPFSVVVGGLYGFTLVWVAVLVVSLQQGSDGLSMSMSRYLGRSVVFGMVYAVAGAVCGLVVALVLMLLVGDARGQRARRAAQLVAASTHAAIALLWVAWFGRTFALLLWLVVTSALVGLVAGWWHDRLASRPRVEDFYAH